MKDHPLCRPPRTETATLRLGSNHRWGTDNGQPGRAFIKLLPKSEKLPATTTVWVAFCDCEKRREYESCPAGNALNLAADHYGGASLERRRAVPKPKLRPKRKKT
jgi:hypothetical protein